MTTEETVSLAPTINLIAQLISPIVGILVAGAVGWLAMAWQKYTGIRLDQQALDRIEKAAATQAGVMVAKAADNLSNTTVTVKNPMVADAVRSIQSSEPKAIETLGVTPEWIAAKVAGEIGKLQSNSAPVPEPHPDLKNAAPIKVAS